MFGATRTFPSTDTLTIFQPHDLRVVFVSGVFCKFKQHFWSREIHMQNITRSGDNPESLIEFDTQWEGKLPDHPQEDENL